jgi:hypothetical protein
LLRGIAINIRISVVRHLKADGLTTILIGKYALGTSRVATAMLLLISILLDSAMLTNK